MNDIEQKMHNESIYYPSDPSLMKKQWGTVNRLRFFNNTPTNRLGLFLRGKMMKKMFADVGENCYIETPFYANWGGRHVHLGNNVYANFHLTCVDDTHIYIGDGTLIGPNVTLVTACHPVSPELRIKQFQYNLPVRIGKNCWLGAGVTVLPGVTIGDNTVIGANSVVTKDIPSDVVAVGNPCRVLRPITEQDNLFYEKTKPIDQNLFN